MAQGQPGGGARRRPLSISLMVCKNHDKTLMDVCGGEGLGGIHQGWCILQMACVQDSISHTSDTQNSTHHWL